MKKKTFLQKVGKIWLLSFIVTMSCSTVFALDPMGSPVADLKQGQLEGGMDQGVGYALREEYILGKTKDWVTFKFPTINNSFEVEIFTCETPRKNGPLGATGIGEMTMVSTAPAVTNAIKNACGARVYNLPATPEKVKAALAAGK